MSALHFTQDWQKDVADFLNSERLPLIVVLGPTASGKTGLSIEVADFVRRMNDLETKETKETKEFSDSRKYRFIEIINADSRQCYRHLDIGTAKITADEMRGVPHHLLSILDPKTECTIAWYQTEATRLIDEIHARGNVPMLVGGSMLYISAIIDGLQPIASDPTVRRRLEAEYDKDEGVSLFARLTDVDPETAAGIPRQNKVYVVRAMEIFESTGVTKSKGLTSKSCPYDLLILGVHREREALMQRIDQRTKDMLGAGWIGEARSLLDRGYMVNDPGMKSHGYPEIAAALLAGDDPMTLASGISAKTRQYAKRQMTWWKGDERIRWVDPQAAD